MRIIGTLLIMLATLLPMLGCNTVKGAGKDVESVGDAMEDAVD